MKLIFVLFAWSAFAIGGAGDEIPLAAAPSPPDGNLLDLARVPAPPSQAPVKKPSKMTLVKNTRNGFVWQNSADKLFYETYPAFIQRNGLQRLTCSTGFCGTASNGPVKPAGGCNCGCNAGTCNCAHSINVYSKIAQTEKAADYNALPLPSPVKPVRKKMPAATAESPKAAKTTSSYCENCARNSGTVRLQRMLFRRR